MTVFPENTTVVLSSDLKIRPNTKMKVIMEFTQWNISELSRTNIQWINFKILNMMQCTVKLYWYISCILGIFVIPGYIILYNAIRNAYYAKRAAYFFDLYYFQIKHAFEFFAWFISYFIELSSKSTYTIKPYRYT